MSDYRMQGIRAAQEDAEAALRNVASFTLKIPQPPDNEKMIFAPLPRDHPTLADLEDFMEMHCVIEPHRKLLRAVFKAEKIAIDRDMITPPRPGIVYTVEPTESTLHLHGGTELP